MKDKAEKVGKSDEAAQIIREFRLIIRSKKKNIIWLAYQQAKVFEKFVKNAKFIELVKQCGFSKSTIIFKINIVKCINKHSKIKNASLSLSFLKNYFKLIKKISEENASEFNSVKNLLKIH